MTFVPLKSVLNDWQKKRKLLEKPSKKKKSLSSQNTKERKTFLFKNSNRKRVGLI